MSCDCSYMPLHHPKYKEKKTKEKEKNQEKQIKENKNKNKILESKCSDLKLELRLQLRQRLEEVKGMYESGKAYRYRYLAMLYIQVRKERARYS